MSSVWQMQGSAGQLGDAVMQQADVAGLRLLEALLVTLPQTLLQTYVLVATDVGLTSPGKAKRNITQQKLEKHLESANLHQGDMGSLIDPIQILDDVTDHHQNLVVYSLSQYQPCLKRFEKVCFIQIHAVLSELSCTVRRYSNNSK